MKSQKLNLIEIKKSIHRSIKNIRKWNKINKIRNEKWVMLYPCHYFCHQIVFNTFQEILNFNCKNENTQTSKEDSQELKDH